MGEQSIDLKGIAETKPRLYQIVNQVPLGVGGQEGPKSRVQLRKSGNTETSLPTDIRGDFITKEYHLEDIDRLRGVLRTNQILRSKGFPVPGTTKYFEKDGKLFELMSDMTEGGKYRLWGWSNDMTRTQSDELHAMTIEDSKFDQIKNQVFALAQLATNEGFSLQDKYYHIRQEVETGLFDLVLLDVDEEALTEPVKDMYDSTGRHESQNRFDARLFLQKLQTQLKDIVIS